MIKELSKDLIGKTIFGYPTGNNQSRSRTRESQPQVLTEFEVIGVGRKYMELKQPKYRHTDKYNLNGSTQQAVNSGFGLNGGYRFFETEEDCNIWIAASNRRQEVKDFFLRHQMPTDEQCEQIHAILFGGEHE